MSNDETEWNKLMMENKTFFFTLMTQQQQQNNSFHDNGGEIWTSTGTDSSPTAKYDSTWDFIDLGFLSRI